VSWNAYGMDIFYINRLQKKDERKEKTSYRNYEKVII